MVGVEGWRKDGQAVVFESNAYFVRNVADKEIHLLF